MTSFPAVVFAMTVCLTAVVSAAGETPARANSQDRPAAVTAAANVPFSSNGCSGFREATFFTCCFVHDFAYWAGGNRGDRSTADHALRRCIQNIAHDSIRSYIGFFLMRLGLGSGVFVIDGWGRAWSGSGRGRFTALTTEQKRIVADEKKRVCESLTLEPATGRYIIAPKYVRSE